MTPRDRAAQKLTSVTAMLVMMMGIALTGRFAMVQGEKADELTLDLFSYAFMSGLGYYIGRNRAQAEANGKAVEAEAPPESKPPAPPAEPPKGA